MTAPVSKSEPVGRRWPRPQIIVAATFAVALTLILAVTVGPLRAQNPGNTGNAANAIPDNDPNAAVTPGSNTAERAPELHSPDLYVFSFAQTEIQDVLRQIAREAGLNVVIGTDVRGTISIHLENVTLQQALDAVTASSYCRTHYDDETNALIIRGLPPEQAEAALRKVVGGEPRSFTIPLDRDIWQIAQAVATIVDETGVVVTNEQTRLLWVTAHVSVTERVATFIDTVLARPPMREGALSVPFGYSRRVVRVPRPLVQVRPDLETLLCEDPANWKVAESGTRTRRPEPERPSRFTVLNDVEGMLIITALDAVWDLIWDYLSAFELADQQQREPNNGDNG